MIRNILRVILLLVHGMLGILKFLLLLVGAFMKLLLLILSCGQSEK